MKRQPYLRFQKEHCNDMWQTDFKGEFRMMDGNYCYPLDILDDHSRFSIRIVPHTSTQNVVIPAFMEAFREFGLPKSILSDNGPQFAGFKKGYTQFERWLKVNSWGYVRFDRFQVYLSETTIGAHIEFRPSLDGTTFAACYRNFKIAEFDTTTGALLNRSITRL